jgi:hypothetical protein
MQSANYSTDASTITRTKASRNQCALSDVRSIAYELISHHATCLINTCSVLCMSGCAAIFSSVFQFAFIVRYVPAARHISNIKVFDLVCLDRTIDMKFQVWKQRNPSAAPWKLGGVRRESWYTGRTGEGSIP